MRRVVAPGVSTGRELTTMRSPSTAVDCVPSSQQERMRERATRYGSKKNPSNAGGLIPRLDNRVLSMYEFPSHEHWTSSSVKLTDIFSRLDIYFLVKLS